MSHELLMAAAMYAVPSPLGFGALLHSNGSTPKLGSWQ